MILLMEDLLEPLPIGQVGFKNLPSKKNNLLIRPGQPDQTFNF